MYYNAYTALNFFSGPVHRRRLDPAVESARGLALINIQGGGPPSSTVRARQEIAEQTVGGGGGDRAGERPRAVGAAAELYTILRVRGHNHADHVPT